MDQKFLNFYHVCTIFGQLWWLFIFSEQSLHAEPSEKVQYLTLDLLKIFFLLTIQKKTIIDQLIIIIIDHILANSFDSKIEP